MNPREVREAHERRLAAEKHATETREAPDFDELEEPEVCRCGKRQYGSKKDAKKTIRREFPGDHTLHPYRCGGWWHIGHLPRRVIAGDKPRAAIDRAPKPRSDKGSPRDRGPRG